MVITEKLKLQGESLQTAYLFKEGAFWVAYESGAYAVWLRKGYRATRKFVKAAGCEVVSLGFPDGALGEILGLLGLGQAEGNVCRVELAEGVDAEAFLTWKMGVGAAQHKSEKCFAPTAVDMVILERLKGFDLLGASPLECMVFLAELKKAI